MLEKISDLKALGIECLTLTVDDPTSVAACHDQVVTLLDGEGLHYLINNAGFGML
jgi:1-acylglycerone phosphate reductase